MNYEESDNYKERIERNIRHRKVVVLSIVLCALLIAMLFGLIVLIKHEDAVTMKAYLNGTQMKVTEQYLSKLIITEKKEKYVNIRYFCDFLGGYKYSVGEYKKYNESPDSCYIQNKCEIVAFTAENDFYTKYTEMDPAYNINGEVIISKNQNGYSENFYIQKPILNKNDELYISLSDAEKVFNVAVDWKNEYRLRIYSLEYLFGIVKNNLPRLQYNSISGYYENIKSILDGFIIVGNGPDVVNSSNRGVKTTLGIVKFDVNGFVEGLASGRVSFPNADEMIGIKYEDIRYIQNMKEFIVTADNSMGLINSEGKTTIPLQDYNKITLLAEKEGLYLVEKERQYGVVSSKGKEIIYPEYDRIGLDISKFDSDRILNASLLFEKCIPYGKVNENGELKYGLMILGEEDDAEKSLRVVSKLDAYYDSLGYISLNTTASATRDRSTLVIPESTGIKGIIVNLNDKFGIFGVEEETLIIPTVFSKIYQAKKDGVSDYYLEISGQDTIPLKDYLIENGFIKR